jgi:hypothetical protein
MSLIVCPGCGVEIESDAEGLDAHYRASAACLGLYHELMAFTLSLRDKDFPHQVAVDTYAAQHCGPEMKPITISFALIGLYLVFEKGYTGRKVQLAHIQLGKLRKRWPRFDPPPSKAGITVRDVLRDIEPENYNGPFMGWGKAVWDTWTAEHTNIRMLIDMNLKT